MKPEIFLNPSDITALCTYGSLPVSMSMTIKTCYSGFEAKGNRNIGDMSVHFMLQSYYEKYPDTDNSLLEYMLTIRDSLNTDTPNISRETLFSLVYIYRIKEYGNQSLSFNKTDFFPIVYSDGKKILQKYIYTFKSYITQETFILIDKGAFDDSAETYDPDKIPSICARIMWKTALFTESNKCMTAVTFNTTGKAYYDTFSDPSDIIIVDKTSVKQLYNTPLLSGLSIEKNPTHLSSDLYADDDYKETYLVDKESEYFEKLYSKIYSPTTPATIDKANFRRDITFDNTDLSSDYKIYSAMQESGAYPVCTGTCSEDGVDESGNTTYCITFNPSYVIIASDIPRDMYEIYVDGCIKFFDSPLTYNNSQFILDAGNYDYSDSTIELYIYPQNNRRIMVTGYYTTTNGYGTLCEENNILAYNFDIDNDSLVAFNSSGKIVYGDNITSTISGTNEGDSTAVKSNYLLKKLKKRLDISSDSSTDISTSDVKLYESATLDTNTIITWSVRQGDFNKSRHSYSTTATGTHNESLRTDHLLINEYDEKLILHESGGDATASTLNMYPIERIIQDDDMDLVEGELSYAEKYDATYGGVYLDIAPASNSEYNTFTTYVSPLLGRVKTLRASAFEKLDDECGEESDLAIHPSNIYNDINTVENMISEYNDYGISPQKGDVIFFKSQDDSKYGRIDEVITDNGINTTVQTVFCNNNRSNVIVICSDSSYIVCDNVTYHILGGIDTGET